MESILNDYISRELVGRPELLPLQNDTPLLETGILDSLALLRLLVFLEQEFSIQVDDFELIPDNFNSINAICLYIRSQQEIQLSQ
jgi:acyl carrier protein